MNDIFKNRFIIKRWINSKSKFPKLPWVGQVSGIVHGRAHIWHKAHVGLKMRNIVVVQYLKPIGARHLLLRSGHHCLGDHAQRGAHAWVGAHDRRHDGSGREVWAIRATHLGHSSQVRVCRLEIQ